MKIGYFSRPSLSGGRCGSARLSLLASRLHLQSRFKHFSHEIEFGYSRQSLRFRLVLLAAQFPVATCGLLICLFLSNYISALLCCHVNVIPRALVLLLLLLFFWVGHCVFELGFGLVVQGWKNTHWGGMYFKICCAIIANDNHHYFCNQYCKYDYQSGLFSPSALQHSLTHF